MVWERKIMVQWPAEYGALEGNGLATAIANKKCILFFLDVSCFYFHQLYCLGLLWFGVGGLGIWTENLWKLQSQAMHPSFLPPPRMPLESEWSPKLKNYNVILGEDCILGEHPKWWCCLVPVENNESWYWYDEMIDSICGSARKPHGMALL